MEIYSLDYSKRRIYPYMQLVHRFNSNKEKIHSRGNKEKQKEKERKRKRKRRKRKKRKKKSKKKKLHRFMRLILAPLFQVSLNE
ncbi:hypothetical protein llap_14351 [Limosa lapponica baueri]|uniref:Uncharacterized protein n=1 Tax=Limosa lapponica baueri TaxID=1758121 RepID=A0A2I0TNN3_LIMLA|nr:hypothetical protein llap_14351 [Limosa lapponica baueri]